MLDTFIAILPVFLLIALGYGLRRSGAAPADVWPALEWLCYYVLVPALIVSLLTESDFGDLAVAPAAVALAAGIAATVGLLLLLAGPAMALGLSGPAFTSVFQGGVRNNVFVSLAVLQGMFGQPAIAVVAIGLSVSVPIVNVASAWVLTRYGSAGAQGLGPTLAALARNPLIVSVALALVLNLLGLGLPGPLQVTLDTLGDAVIALSLLCVGAGLRLRGSLRQLGPAVGASVAAKLAVVPALTAAAAALLGLPPAETGMAVAFNAAPTASASYILARQLGGDHALMARIITLQTLCAIATMPAAVALLA
jgi:hypothetical protein